MEVDHEVDSSRERTTAVGGPGPLALPGKTLEWGGVNWTLDMDMDMDMEGGWLRFVASGNIRLPHESTTPRCPHVTRTTCSELPKRQSPLLAPQGHAPDWEESRCAISRARSAASCGQINSTARHGLGNSTGSSAWVLDALNWQLRLRLGASVPQPLTGLWP